MRWNCATFLFCWEQTGGRGGRGGGGVLESKSKGKVPALVHLTVSWAGQMFRASSSVVSLFVIRWKHLG